VRAAKAAGALAIGVLCGFGERQDLAEADLLCAMLADHHIPSHVSGRYLQGAIGDLPVHDLLGLWVQDEDQARSEQLIQQYLSATPVDDDESWQASAEQQP